MGIIMNCQRWMMRCMVDSSLCHLVHMSVFLFPCLGNKRVKVSILTVVKIVHTDIIQMYYKL